MTEGARRAPKQVKVVFSWRCGNLCRYCALTGSPAWPAHAQEVLAPELLAERLGDLSRRYEVTALEVGAGETLDHPDLWDRLVAFNDERLRVPIHLFTSLLSDSVETSLDVIERSGQPVSFLVSYDGRASGRNRGNWPLVEERYRGLKRRCAEHPHLSARLSACLLPSDVPDLLESLRSLVALDPSPGGFSFRPVKRRFTEAEERGVLEVLEAFLPWAERRGVRLVDPPAPGKPLVFRPKPCWDCHREAVSLLPDGRFTDCYVAYYCADFDEGRTVASLDGYEEAFDARPVPSSPACATCLDAFGFCNQCPAGLADWKRSTGQDFYEPSFCRLVGGISAALLTSALSAAEGQTAIIHRRGAGVVRARLGSCGLEVEREPLPPVAC